MQAVQMSDMQLCGVSTSSLLEIASVAGQNAVLK